MALQRASSNTAMHQRNLPQTHDQKTVKKHPRYPENTMVKTQGPTLLHTRKKCPPFPRKHDGENSRTNTATHQKKCPRYPENTMEKTQEKTMEKTQEKMMERNHNKNLCSITQGAHKLMVEAWEGLWNKISPNILHIYIVKKKPLFTPNIPPIYWLVIFLFLTPQYEQTWYHIGP